MSALLNTYGDGNRVIDSGLSIRYQRSRITGSWSWVLPGGSGTYSRAWSYTRTATYSYRYVGMTRSAAKTCMDAMVDYYTRETRYTDWEPSISISEFQVHDGGNIVMADISMQNTGGDMWEVIVNVNENDSLTYLSGDYSYSQVFSAEDDRSYDGWETN